MVHAVVMVVVIWFVCGGGGNGGGGEEVSRGVGGTFYEDACPSTPSPTPLPGLKMSSVNTTYLNVPQLTPWSPHSVCCDRVGACLKESAEDLDVALV